MPRSRPQKFYGARLFKCLKRGTWETVDRCYDGSRYGIYFMINQWEAYKAIHGEPIEGDMIARAFTFDEVVAEIRDELEASAH